MSIRPWPLLLLLALALPGACTAPPTAETAPAAPDTAAAPPGGAPSLRVALGANALRQATLLQDQGRRRLWRAGEGMALMTDGPRVVATAGLAEVLVGTRVVGQDPLLAPDALLTGEAETLRLVDLATGARDPGGMRFGLPIACRLQATASADRPDLLEVTERCQGPAEIGSFANRFVLRRADAAALRTEQWIGPGLPLLVTEP